MKAGLSDVSALPPSVSVRRGLDLSALVALGVLTFRQNVRGRRLIILSLLFLLPSVIAILTRLAPYPPPPEMFEFSLVFLLIPHALVTLTALLYSAGCIQDEVEEQTLTYLLLRPLPRWAIYCTRLFVTWLTTTLLTGVFTFVTYIVIYWGTSDLWGDVIPVRASKTVALLALMLCGYCCGFGALGMYTRRALFAGLIYILAFEGLLANIEFVGRRMTVMYYFRILADHWLQPSGAKAWSIALETAPTVNQCLYILLGASAVFALLGALLMMRREFRMKTQEGS
jgi:ABC-2 type transport system permease protein